MFLFVVFITVATTGYCEDGTKFKRSLISRFTSNPLFHKFFRQYDDYQSPVYTSTQNGNYGDYQEYVYTDSWDENEDGKYEFSYVTPGEASEEDGNSYYDEIDEEKDKTQIDTQFSEGNKETKINEDKEKIVKQMNFFNTLPWYERAVVFKIKHKKENPKNEGKQRKKKTKSDIRFDEEDDTEENQPLFNSLPFYETAVAFRNHEKNEEKTEVTKPGQHEDEDDQSQVPFNFLPYFEVAHFLKNSETHSPLPEKDRLLVKIDRNDSVFPIRPQYHINWLINVGNEENLPDLPIVRLVKNVTRESKRQEKKDGFVTSKPIKSEFITSKPIEDDFITSKPIEDHFITPSRPVADDFTTSEPVALHRNQVFVSKVNPAVQYTTEDQTNWIYDFKSLPLYDNIDLFFKIMNDSLDRSEEEGGRKDSLRNKANLTEATLKESKQAEEMKEKKLKDEYITKESSKETFPKEQIEKEVSKEASRETKKGNIENVLGKEKAKENFENRDARRLKIRPNKDENVQVNLIQEKLSSMEMPMINSRVKENAQEEEGNTGTAIYIFKSLPYFDRSQPFSVTAKVMNNTLENTKEEMETQVIPNGEERKLLEILNNEGKVKEEKKKLRGRRRKVKKILVARRQRKNLAKKKRNGVILQDSADIQSTPSLAFGDRTEPRKKFTGYKHIGELPLAADTHVEYEVDSYGAPLNFTYDLNVLNQLNNNLINKEKL